MHSGQRPQALCGHDGRDPLRGLDGLGDDAAATAFRSFLRVVHLHRRSIIQRLRDIGAHPAQAFCLRLLVAADGSTQGELAGEMLLTPPTVSRMLKAMEQAGVVERRPDAGDQRVVRVYLTGRGRALAEQLRSVTVQYVSDTFGGLSDVELGELARLLDKLSAQLEATSGRREGRAR